MLKWYNSQSDNLLFLYIFPFYMVYAKNGFFDTNKHGALLAIFAVKRTAK